MFTCKQCIGFIGGKDYSATYFIGYSGNNIFYLDPHYAQQCVYLYETYGFSKYDKQLLQKLEKKKELARKKKEESKREKFVGEVGWTLRYDPTVPDHSVKVSKKFAKKGTILIFEDYDLYGIYDTIAEGKSNDYVIYINVPEMDGHIVEIESKEEAKG